MSEHLICIHGFHSDRVPEDIAPGQIFISIVCPKSVAVIAHLQEGPGQEWVENLRVHCVVTLEW